MTGTSVAAAITAGAAALVLEWGIVRGAQCVNEHLSDKSLFNPGGDPFP